MNYEKKYLEALEKARQFSERPLEEDSSSIVEYIFPELKESEDEKIIKELITHCRNTRCVTEEGAERIAKWIAWLEKQGKRDARYENLEELLEADTIYQMAMNDAMVEEAKTKAINALSELEIGKLLGLEKQGEPINDNIITRDDEILQAISIGLTDALENFGWSDFGGLPIEEIQEWLEKQGEQNPYSGASFKYNGHTFGMCARDGGAEILIDGNLKAFISLDKSFIYPVIPIPSFKAENFYVSKVDGLIHDSTYNSTEKHEPKFHNGDWVTDGYLHCKISDVLDDRYIVDTKFAKRSAITFKRENNYHLWTIQDAKDGDVLVNGSNIFIFHFIKATRLMGYCHVNTDDGRFYDDIGKNECFCLIDAVVTPATNAQRDILFQKMKEVGYEWDAEKKELKPIDNRFDYENANIQQKDFAPKAVTAHRQVYNRAILKILSNYVEKYPDIRFGQMLCNLGIGPVFNEESRETYCNLNETINKQKS